MQSKKSSKSSSDLKLSPQSKDLPATQGMLQLVRVEFKANVRELRSEMKAEFKQVDSRFNQVEARFNQVDARFNQVDAKFSQIDARFNQVDSRFDQVDSKIERVMEAVHHMASEVARVGILMEEQNSRNRIVLEGLTGLSQRQERLELESKENEKLIRSIVRGRA